MTTSEFSERYVGWLTHDEAIVRGLANLAWAYVAWRNGESKPFVRSFRQHGWSQLRQGARLWRTRRRPTLTPSDRALLGRLDCTYGQPAGCPRWWDRVTVGDRRFCGPLPAYTPVAVADFCDLRALVEKLIAGAVHVPPSWGRPARPPCSPGDGTGAGVRDVGNEDDALLGTTTISDTANVADGRDAINWPVVVLLSFYAVAVFGLGVAVGIGVAR